MTTVDMLTTLNRSAGVNPGAAFGSPEALQDVFHVLEQGNVKTIDTAALYGSSEEILGKAGAGKRFTIDTKLKGGFGSGSSKNVIQGEAENSKKMLGTSKVQGSSRGFRWVSRLARPGSQV